MSNERRKYYRTSLVLPIEVYSYACERSRFYEQTETLNVSPLGASFRLYNKVDIDDIVRLVIPMPLQLRLYDQDLSEYQIYAQVRRTRSRADGYINVGVAFISKDAPDIEINQPVLVSKLALEPMPPDSDDVFMTRPIGPQGLIKSSLSLPNPLASNQKSLGLPSSNLLNSQSSQSIKPISNPLVDNPSSNPLILPPARPESVSLKHPTIAQNNSSSERNEPRAKLRLSLSIRGLDKHGQYFVEIIQTEDVSKHGICFMLCKHELDVNSIVEIVGFQGKFQAQGEVKHINFNLVDKTYRVGIRLLGQPNNWIVK